MGVRDAIVQTVIVTALKGNARSEGLVMDLFRTADEAHARDIRSTTSFWSGFSGGSSTRPHKRPLLKLLSVAWRKVGCPRPRGYLSLDINKIGRIGSLGHRITGRRTGKVNRHLGIDWEFVHVCIDDASRVAFVQVMPDERKTSAVAFLEAAVAYMPSWASGSSA